MGLHRLPGRRGSQKCSTNMALAGHRCHPALSPITTQPQLLHPLGHPGDPDGTQQSPSTSVPTRAAHKALVLHHMPTVPCSCPAETVLLLALRGRNEQQSKFLAYTKKKKEKLSLGVHRSSQEWPVGRKGFSPRTALVQAGFLQLVKHSYPL